MYQVRLTDGSLIDLRLLAKELDIITGNKKVKVSVADVRRIDVGFRYSEGVENRVEAAVARLKDADFKVRDAAGKELLDLKELAFPALTRAVKSDDLEVKRRATVLVRKLEDKLPSELLRNREHDLIVTPQFPIAGRIVGLTLKVQSRIFGDGQLWLEDMLEARPLTGEIMAIRTLLEGIRSIVHSGRTTRRRSWVPVGILMKKCQKAEPY